MAILQAVTIEETPEQELARLREENEKLKAKANRAVWCKVSEKGALSIYGLGRFPVTLYLSQYEKLIDSLEMINTFIGEHVSEFSVKE